MNGDFEQNEGWTFSNTPYKARYTDAMARAGVRSLQLGIANLVDNRFTYSSADQQFRVPPGVTARLAFWYHMPNSGGEGDYGYFLIHPEGGPWRILRIIRGSTAGWTPIEADVSHYSGSSFTLRLGVRNDGSQDGAAAVMYVDSLSVQGCNP